MHKCSSAFSPSFGAANGLAQGSAAADESTFATTQPKRTHSLRLVIDDVLLSALGGSVPREFVVIPEGKLNSPELVRDARFCPAWRTSSVEPRAQWSTSPKSR